MNDISVFFEQGHKFESSKTNELNGIVGLYFIYNSDIEIQYPFGKSKLIYIGMSEKRTNSIGRRLQGHLEGLSGNDGITNYLKSNVLFFTHINFEMLKSKWPLRVEALEGYFIKNFVTRYGVYPICNNKVIYNTNDNKHINLTIDWKHFE
jgi:hypothetical protein